MRSIPRRPCARTVIRRLAAVALCALFAAGAVLGTALISRAAAQPRRVPPPPPSSPADVVRSLNVKNVRTEIVILVDISLSMGDDGDALYPTVRQKVLSYLGVLQQQDKQDLVGIIAFGKRTDNQETDPGAPTPDVYLPPAPFSQETDFGYAFQQAVQMLRDAPADVAAGAVLLLSDGELSVEPGSDPQYGTGFTGPGWTSLKKQVAQLSQRMPITGYDVPLTSNTAYIGNQRAALAQVFPTVQGLPSGTANLSTALNLATQGTYDSAVAYAASPDLGQGIQVISWSGLHGVGSKPLDLGSGQAEVTVTVQAMTHHAPLYLSGLSVVSAGLPVTMRGSLPAGYLVPAGQKIPLTVRLTWKPRRSGETAFGTPRATHGTLTLTGQVSSPFTPTLQDMFGDTGFSVGGVQRGNSPILTASEPVVFSILVVVVLAVLGAIMIAVACTAAARAWLTGEVRVTATRSTLSEVFKLHGWRQSVRLDEPLKEEGLLTVWRSPRHRRMKVKMQVNDRDPFTEVLVPGEAAFPAGFVIELVPRKKQSNPGSHDEESHE